MRNNVKNAKKQLFSVYQKNITKRMEMNYFHLLKDVYAGQCGIILFFQVELDRAGTEKKNKGPVARRRETGPFRVKILNHAEIIFLST